MESDVIEQMRSLTPAVLTDVMPHDKLTLGITLCIAAVASRSVAAQQPGDLFPYVACLVKYVVVIASVNFFTRYVPGTRLILVVGILKMMLGYLFT